MRKVNSHQRAVIGTLLLAIGVNSLIFYFVLNQLDGINKLNRNWQKNATHSVQQASLLARIERDLGYLGFIHHFKNYILRGDEFYYKKALKSFSDT